MRHAEKCLALGAAAGAALTPFDRATAHGCAASAYALAERADDARRQWRLCAAEVDALDDPAEAALVRRLYPAP